MISVSLYSSPKWFETPFLLLMVYYYKALKMGTTYSQMCREAMMAFVEANPVDSWVIGTEYA